jgi:nicotinamidase-related amidase
MKTALLVVDMQNVFAPMVQHSLPNVIKLISHFRARKLPAIFTQHGHSEEELTPPFPNQLVRKWGPNGSIHFGSKDWEFIPEIAEEVERDSSEAPVIPKNTYDAFLGGRLEPLLRGEGVERVVVCGVMTDCCCDTTARSAFNRGFETWLVDDACGTANEKQHQSGLAGFGFAFGEVVMTENVIERIAT